MNNYQKLESLKTIYEAPSELIYDALNLKEHTYSLDGNIILYVVSSESYVNYLLNDICNYLDYQKIKYILVGKKEIISNDGHILIVSISNLNKKDICGRKFKEVHFLLSPEEWKIKNKKKIEQIQNMVIKLKNNEEK